MQNLLSKHTGLAILITLMMIIVIRELSVEVAAHFDIESMGNILGMILFLFILLAWRFSFGLPAWLTNASNKILTESAYAYLPVSAGAGILMFQLGDEFTRIVLVMVLATVPPLWFFAKLSATWLQTDSKASEADAQGDEK